MQELLEFLPSREVIRDFLNSAGTWRQVAVFVVGLLVVKLIARWLQPRLQTMIQPGAIEGVRRTAVRSGALALVPLILWLWLLAAITILRQYGWDASRLTREAGLKQHVCRQKGR